MSAPEIWLPVVSFEGQYEVSDLGRVRSVARIQAYERVLADGRVLPIVRHLAGRILSPGTVKSGHQIVILGRGNPRLVHALVLSAFVGPRPPGHDSCHNDGTPSNNRLTNLRWGTRSENVRDAQRHGTYRGGSKAGQGHHRTLTEAQIPTIRRALSGGASCRDLAGQYGVTPSAIYLIKIGRNWSHVPHEVAA